MDKNGWTKIDSYKSVPLCLKNDDEEILLYMFSNGNDHIQIIRINDMHVYRDNLHDGQVYYWKRLKYPIEHECKCNLSKRYMCRKCRISYEKQWGTKEENPEAYQNWNFG